MAAQRVADSEFFNAYRKVDSVKELIELTKLSDDELYRTIGNAARDSMSEKNRKSEDMPDLEPGDYTGRAPNFFHTVKEGMTYPGVYLDLPQDPTEAGKTVVDQLSASFDKIMCQTVGSSSLQGYKQEAMTLGMQCMEALSREFPTINKEIVGAYVALRTKRQFNSCSRW